MKGEAGPGGGTLRKALVVFQFAISIVLIIGTVVVWRQLSYMQHKNLGFDEEQVVVLPMRSEMLDRYDVLREHLLAEPGIVEVGAASSRPGRSIPGNLIRLEGQEPQSMRMIWVDLHLTETLDMEIVAGRNLSERFPSDEESGFLINEAAAEQAGWSDPVGKKIEWVLPDSVLKSGAIVGVVRDFHIQPLDTPIEPLLMFVSRPHLQHVFIRLAPGEPQQSIAAIERYWTAAYPDNPFPFEYSFLDEHLDQLYEAEQRLARIFGTFALLTIIIACLGLFGLAAYTAERRTREIGVRKVLGATVPSIVALLSRDFLPPIGIAFVVAAPTAYILMHRWLEGFAYRAELSVSIFLVAGLLTFMIALVTVGLKSIRAALANPVESLRHE